MGEVKGRGDGLLAGGNVKQMSNTSALTLYRGIGLGSELYRYHYRRQKSV